MGALKYGLEEFYDPVHSDWMGLGPEWNSGMIFGGFHRESYEMDDGGTSSWSKRHGTSPLHSTSGARSRLN